MSDNQGYWETDEEGYIFRGQYPPQSEHWQTYDWIEIPHEHHIPISKYQLQRMLCEALSERPFRRLFNHVFNRMLSIYRLHYLQLLDILQQDYEYFDPDGGLQKRQALSSSQLLKIEQRFLANLLLTLKKSHFLPFTESYAQRAREYDYLFDLSVKIKWNKHDEKMLTQFINSFAKNNQQQQQWLAELEAKDIASHLDIPHYFKKNSLIFWRGMGRDKREENRFLYKLDILISHLFDLLLFPIKRLIEFLRGEKNRHQLFRDVGKDVKDIANQMTFHLFEQKHNTNTEQSSFDKRWLRRMNTQNQKVNLHNILKPIRLQEPLLDKVCCIFRLRPPSYFWNKLKYFTGKNKVKIKHPYKDIHLKMFRQIPLADCLLVLPFKSPAMRSSDYSLLVMIVLGSLFTISQGIQAKGAVFLVIVIILITIFMRLILSYQRATLKYNNLMIAELYDKNITNHAGVLQYLVNSIEQQTFLEAVLCYYVLWENQSPMTEMQLNHAIEQLIKKKFQGVEIDFQITKTLLSISSASDNNPLTFELVHTSIKDNTTYYRAIVLEDALQVLDNTWLKISR